MRTYLIRAAVLTFAVVLTFYVFNFWGDFGRVLDNYLTMETKPDKPKNTGVITMTIIQPNQKPSCDKQHPCPKP